jgi:hypothetical protein
MTEYGSHRSLTLWIFGVTDTRFIQRQHQPPITFLPLHRGSCGPGSSDHPVPRPIRRTTRHDPLQSLDGEYHQVWAWRSDRRHLPSPRQLHRYHQSPAPPLSFGHPHRSCQEHCPVYVFFFVFLSFLCINPHSFVMTVTTLFIPIFHSLTACLRVQYSTR